MGLLALKARSVSTAATAKAGIELREPCPTTLQIEPINSLQDEAASALINLGYRTPEVNKAITLALIKMNETYELEDLIRTTLKELAKG